MKSQLGRNPQKAIALSTEMRWKWMVGTGAVVGAAAVSNSEAGIRQITLSANQITSGGPNTLSADVTRDGVTDLTGLASLAFTSRTVTFTSSGNYYYRNIASASVYSTGPGGFKNFGRARYRTGFTSIIASTNRTNSFTSWSASAGSNAANGVFAYNYAYNSGNSPQSASGLTAITFTDARINGGAPTEAFVNTRTFNNNTTSHTVQLVRTIFNDANTKIAPGIQPHVTYREFDPTVYAQRTRLASKIKKFEKKAKKWKKTNKSKANKFKKKAKKAAQQLAGLA